jgi:hypothetical protein
MFHFLIVRDKKQTVESEKNIFGHCDITLKIGKRLGKKLARIDSNFANSKWGNIIFLARLYKQNLKLGLKPSTRAQKYFTCLTD